MTEKKRNPPRLLPADPRLKTAAALQNGDKSSSNNVIREEHQAKSSSSTIIDKNRSRSSSESSLFNVSPIRPREAPAPVPCFEIGHSDKNNADLSLKINIENKGIDNDSTQRCSNRKNKTSNKKTVKSGEEQESKISSPSKSSSTTRSSSSSSSSKSKEPSSSSSSSSSSTRKSKSRSSKNTSSSSSSSSSSPRKKSSSSSSKSRKRSRSPHHHHHHHHSSPKATFSEPHLGLSEEEQLGGSIVVSPPQPVLTAAAGKDGKENQHRKDNSISGTRKERKHNRDNAKSPEKSSRSQDEDLRPALLVPPTPTTGISVAAASAGASVTPAALVTSELSSLTQSMRRGRKLQLFLDYIAFNFLLLLNFHFTF